MRVFVKFSVRNTGASSTPAMPCERTLQFARDRVCSDTDDRLTTFSTLVTRVPSSCSASSDAMLPTPEIPGLAIGVSHRINSRIDVDTLKCATLSNFDWAALSTASPGKVSMPYVSDVVVSIGKTIRCSNRPCRDSRARSRPSPPTRE